MEPIEDPTPAAEEISAEQAVTDVPISNETNAATVAASQPPPPLPPTSPPTTPAKKRSLGKIIGLTLLGLITIFAIGIFALYSTGKRRLQTAPAVTGNPVAVPTDAEAIERGQRLAQISSCTGCHTGNLGGEIFVNEAPIGYIPAPNLTSGTGGIGADYSAEDWELAIRHGVAQDGRTIVTMPSDHYAHYGDDDLGDLIAYLQQVPAVDSDWGPRDLQFGGTIIFGVLAYDSWAASSVDHAAVGGAAPAAEITVERGEYMINISSCTSCHAENFAGNAGQLDSPLGPNLTTITNDWTFAEFNAALQTGQTPSGTVLSPEMPWPLYSSMTDVEAEAIWEYLQTLEALPDNTN